MWLCYSSPLKLLCFSPFPSLQSYSAHRRRVLFPLLLQFANFCKIASVFAFQIKEWFQFNMLQAHLSVINNS